MGIRFHCPNGHKLNVKSFLAGKKGVCPDCGTKLRIPERSEPGLGGADDEGDQPIPPQSLEKPAVTAASVQPAGPVVMPSSAIQPVASHPAVMPAAAVIPVHPLPTQPLPAQPLPAQPLPAQPLPAQPLPAQPLPAQPLPTVAMPTYPQPAPAPVVVPAMPVGRAVPVSAPVVAPAPVPSSVVAADPISENPMATWFVRPPSGGQFGPARGEVMRKWLDEGRVTRDSLVWREGWTDWLAATEVFPSLGKPAIAVGGPPAPTSKSAATTYKPKKSSGAMGVAILVFLAIVCLALAGVLVFVLSGGMAST